MQESAIFQGEVLDAHKSIINELEQLKVMIDHFEHKLEMTTIKPIPAHLIRRVTEVREVLKDHGVSQYNTPSNCNFDFYYCVQHLGSVIDYLYKYNKSLSK